MEKKKLKIGIDISKLTLDVCYFVDNEKCHQQVKNKPSSIKSFLLKLKKRHNVIDLELFMENTGLYNWAIYQVGKELDILIYVINPLHLKRSIGLTRGKDDKIDAVRILLFSERFYDTLKPYPIPSKVIQKIKLMFALRSRIIDAKKLFKAPITEVKSMVEKENYKEVLSISNKIIKQLDSQLKAVEKELDLMIQEDECIYENFQYITSVQGVGKVLACYLILKTNNFTLLNDPKKLACYAGVVPFDYQSGTSIYRKPRVSFLADKKLKKILHMAALRVVRLDGDLKKYYIKKVIEGKNKMSVINAVRNKLITRICSVVNNKRIYQINLQLS